MEHISRRMMVGPLSERDKMRLSSVPIQPDRLYPISMLVGPLSEKEKSRYSNDFCVKPLSQDTFYITNCGGKQAVTATEELQTPPPASIKSCRPPTSSPLHSTIKSCSAPTPRTVPKYDGSSTYSRSNSGTGFFGGEGGPIGSGGARGECAFHHGTVPCVIVRNGTRSEAWFLLAKSVTTDQNGASSEIWVRLPEGGMRAGTTPPKANAAGRTQPKASAKKSFFALKHLNCFRHTDYTVYA